MNQLDELVEFVRTSERLDVQSVALHHMLSMTGDFESRKLLVAHKHALDVIARLAFDNSLQQKALNKDAFFCLINLSADEIDAAQLLTHACGGRVVQQLLAYITDETSRFADTACAVLSNLSRGKANSQRIFEAHFKPSRQETNNNNNEKEEEARSGSLEHLLKVFCTEGFNKTNTLDYLAPFICNLTQLEEVRTVILESSLVLQRLLPYTTYQRSIIRRGGIVGAIKNCCFNYDYHEKLLFSPEIDILSRLLLPLAGPEELDSDEMDKLPDDLQYLPPDKQREEDADVRTMLVESIMMLCAHKKCRDYIKEKNAYVILREYHKWESDEKTQLVLEKLIQILISDEPHESELENLHEVVVPDELTKKFYSYEQTELEKNFK